jgi:hypothetical protein
MAFTRGCLFARIDKPGATIVEHQPKPTDILVKSGGAPTGQWVVDGMTLLDAQQEKELPPQANVSSSDLQTVFKVVGNKSDGTVALDFVALDSWRAGTAKQQQNYARIRDQYLLNGVLGVQVNGQPIRVHLMALRTTEYRYANNKCDPSEPENYNDTGPFKPDSCEWAPAGYGLKSSSWAKSIIATKAPSAPPVQLGNTTMVITTIFRKLSNNGQFPAGSTVTSELSSKIK